MAFPTIPTVAANRLLTVNQADTSATRTFPNLGSLVKNNGDLLIAIAVVYQASGTGATFSGWGASFTEFGDFGISGSTMGIGCAYKRSDGTETGTFTVTQAGTPTGHASLILMSIPGVHASSAPEAGSFASGTAAAADPPAFDPAGWAAEDTLWIDVGASGETNTAGSYTGLASAPANYTGYADTGITADVVGGCEGAVAFRQVNAASEDAGVFSVDLSNARNAAVIIAVRPAVETSAATGSISMDKMSVSVSASGEAVATGSTSLKKMTISGAGGPYAGLSNRCEGSNGVTVDTTNSDGPDQFSQVTTAGTGVCAYDTGKAHRGSSSIKIASGVGTSGQGLLLYTGLDTATTQRYQRAYIWWDGTAPTDINVRIMSLSNLGSLRISITGHLTLRSSSGALMATMTAVLPSNQWVRIELDHTNINWTAVTSDMAARMFSGSNLDTNTPDTDGTMSATAVTLGGTHTSPDSKFGLSASVTETNGWTCWYDNIASSDSATPGPMPPASSGNISMDKMQISGSAAGESAATGSISLKKMSVSGSVSGETVVAGGVILEKMFVSGSAAGEAVATGTIGLEKMSVSGSAAGEAVGTGNVGLEKMSVSGAGAGEAVGTGTIGLEKMSVSGAGAGETVATGSVSLEKMQILGTQEEAGIFSGGVSLEKMSVFGSAAGETVVTGAISLEKMSVSGSVAGETVVTGSIGLEKMSVSGAGAGEAVGSGSVSLEKMQIFGTQEEEGIFSGGVTLEKMSVSGSGTGKTTATGSTSLEKMSVSGSVAGETAATGSISLEKMTISGTGAPPETSVATGNVVLPKMRIQGSSGQLIEASDLFIFSLL